MRISLTKPLFAWDCLDDSPPGPLAGLQRHSQRNRLGLYTRRRPPGKR